MPLNQRGSGSAWNGTESETVCPSQITPSLVRPNHLSITITLNALTVVVSNLAFIPFRQNKLGSKPPVIKILLLDGSNKLITMEPTFSGPVFDQVQKILDKNEFKLLITDDMRKCGPPLNLTKTPLSEECEVHS